MKISESKVIKKSNLDPIIWSYKFDSDGNQYLSNTFTSRQAYTAWKKKNSSEVRPDTEAVI